MPTGLAEYGVAALSLGITAWIIVRVFGPRSKDPDFLKVIADNTKALTQLTAVIQSQGDMIEAQGQVLQKQAELLTELRVEIVRKVG